MSALDRQQAIVAALMATLGADRQLATLIGRRIYDAPPARAVMPSVTVRMVSAPDNSTADTEAQNLVFDLDVWDRYELGSDLSRPRVVMAHIRRLLHMQTLSASGIAVLAVRCTGAQGPFRDPDEVALHGIVTVSVLAGHEAAFD